MTNIHTSANVDNQRTEDRFLEVDKILLPLVGKRILNSQFQFNGFKTTVDPTADTLLPLVTNIYVSHISLSGYFENEAMSISGNENILSWLDGMNLLDGSVDFRLNPSE